jgi:hypothetical protein
VARQCLLTPSVARSQSRGLASSSSCRSACGVSVPPHPLGVACSPSRGLASSSSCRVVSCRSALTKLPQPSPSVPAYNVAAGHSRWSSVQVSDTGGSRRSYRNERPCLTLPCQRAPPSPRGPQVVGGRDAWLVVIQRAVRLASSRSRPQCSPWFPPGPVPRFQRVGCSKA